SINKVILFGGGFQDSTSYSYFGDTWIYNPKTNLWTEIFPREHPTARSSHSMVYDPINQKVILFGGVDLNDNWMNDTWIFDSRTKRWTEVFPENSPSIRGSSSTYYDIQAEKVILFGGYQEVGGHLDDTWAYDYSINNWTNLNPSIKPTGRYGAPMIYDPINERGLFFGGRTTIITDETWVYYYSNNSWLELSLSTMPSNRYWDGLAYDESAQSVILYGGRVSGGIGEATDQTWLFDPSTNQWTQTFPSSSPANRFHISLVYDREREKIILFGGFRFPDMCFSDTWGYNYETNNWNKLK
ncbi:MAG: Kelch repeat-containing protein, partial [Promethearchaeota archaeon]